MSEELLAEALASTTQPQKQLTLWADQFLPAQPIEPLTPEQIKALDAVFVQDRENAALAGFIGFWGGAMLIGDLAQEHLSRSAEEEERAKRQKLLGRDSF